MSMKFFPFSLIVLGGLAAVLSSARPALAETITFQQGVAGYDRAQDTSIRWAYTTRFGDTGEVDLDHAGDPGAYEMWSTGGGRTSVLEVGNFFKVC